MVERAVYVSVRALVTGAAFPPAASKAVAAPAGSTRLGPFEVHFEPARPRVLPGEENQLSVRWVALEPSDLAVDLEIVVDVPAELTAPPGGRSAKLRIGGGTTEGAATFTLVGVEPGGVRIDAVLTLEDEGGTVLGRAKAGYSLSRHRVIVADVEVTPAVVEAGGDATVRARYVWTGADRVRGALGGMLKRRGDGQTVELRAEKVSALGERVQEWRVKAPVDQQVADFDVELHFEGKDGGQKAGYGKTGVLAVRRRMDAEVVSLKSAAPRAGGGDAVEVEAVLRNTGVEPLTGEATLTVAVRRPGAAEPEPVAEGSGPKPLAVDVPPQSSTAARFPVTIPDGFEGSRLEGHVTFKHAGGTVERRATLLQVVRPHVLDFDGFAADRFAYGPGEPASIECRVRDEGSRAGGRFTVEFALKDGQRDVASARAMVELTSSEPSQMRVELALPPALAPAGPLDLEVRAPEVGASRRVLGLVRVRQAVASRVIVIKPPAAQGVAAFLFEGEAVVRDTPLGELPGVGAARLVEVSSGGFFFVGAGGTPIEEPGEALERAAARALWSAAPVPTGGRRAGTWSAVLGALATGGHGARSADRSREEPIQVPSDVAAALLVGRSFEEASEQSAGVLQEALHYTDVALGGGRLPATEVANMWGEAAEEVGTTSSRADLARCAAALLALRNYEADLRGRQGTEGLSAAGVRALAQSHVLSRAVEAELFARALRAGAPDAVLGLSVTAKSHEDRIRSRIRFWSLFLSRHQAVVSRAMGEARARRQIAALRDARVSLKGAEAIMPGRYNTVELHVQLPPGAPAGGLAVAAVALPSELWILGTESAQWTRGQYLMPALPLEPGSSAAWKLELYVPDRAAGEPGAIEVRLGFEAEGTVGTEGE